MKKLLSGVVMASLITASASAAWLTGTVENVSVYGETMYIMVGTSTKRIDPEISVEGKKIIHAAALTAFASGKTVKVRYSAITSGTWDAIQLIN